MTELSFIVRIIKTIFKILIAFLLIIIVAIILFVCFRRYRPKTVVEKSIESHWQEWMKQGNDTTECVIDFSEVMDFEWDTMIYYSGNSYNYYHLPPDLQIDLGAYIEPHSETYHIAFFKDTKLASIYKFPKEELFWDENYKPDGFVVATDEVYLKLSRENTEFRITTFENLYLLHHISDGDDSLKSNFVLHPFSGSWRSIENYKDLSLSVSERNDSILISLLYIPIARKVQFYPKFDNIGFEIPQISIPLISESDTLKGRINRKHLYLPSDNFTLGYDNVTLTLVNDTTLYWHLDSDNPMWPKDVTLVRYSKTYNTFSPNIPVDN